MPSPSTLDIILPCFNPQQNWEQQVVFSCKEIYKALPHIKIQLILVNDGSVTGFENDVVDKIRKSVHLFQYISYADNRGKGYALREGMKKSTAEIVMYTDVDFPYTTKSFLDVFRTLSENACDVSAGIKDKRYYNHTPTARKYISKLLRFFSKIFLRIKITDTQCGLKGMNEKGKQIFLATTINRYLFDLEFLFHASRKKELRLTAVEIQLREQVQFSTIPYSILFTETGNFLRIFLHSIFAGKG